MFEANEVNAVNAVNAAEQKRLALLHGEESASEPVESEEAVLSPKALDELREILRSDETVREFFLLLKNRDLRKEAISKLNDHLAR